VKVDHKQQLQQLDFQHWRLVKMQEMMFVDKAKDIITLTV
jgi:hypothetical protein